jgi:hypothetical protein
VSTSLNGWFQIALELGLAVLRTLDLSGQASTVSGSAGYNQLSNNGYPQVTGIEH